MFPTMDEVNHASKLQLGRWYRLFIATTPEERRVLDHVSKRLDSLGGMTAELSAQVGFGGIEPPKEKARLKAKRASSHKG